ncbi:MAG: ABC transporter permease [Eubacteriales bacterium]|nr:ABC transporter permease [Eubacteriales bacterium]
MSMLVSACMQGMIYAPMALGVYIAFGILNTPDLTIDGSLVFGMTVCAYVTIAGHPVLALFAGMAAGAAAGLVTGLLQTKLKINAILSGILTMTGLYTINYMVLGGQSNRYLQSGTTASNTVFKMFSRTVNDIFGENAVGDINLLPLILSATVTAAAIAILAVFFKTRLGLQIRATGDNEDMVRSSSINADFTRILGIMTANALVALSGALLCQQQKYADLNCGMGMLVVGLASVIIGQVLFGKRGITVGLISAVAGSLFYRIVLQVAYKIDMPSFTVKLLSAIIVVAALSMPVIKNKVTELNGRRARASSGNEGSGGNEQ